MSVVDPLQILQQYWGYSSFRAGQSAIIKSALRGHDTLAILSTGAGKSICYQLPALMMPGICVVVSPLVALMRDQVYSLLRKKISAVAITSTMTRYEQVQAYEAMVAGSFKFVFVSPERAQSQLFKSYLESIQVSLIAVDEAHCISQWGYDFRPPYLRIAELRELCANASVLALTASATELVQADILQKLKMKSAQVFKGSVQRDNLSLSCIQVQSKYDVLLQMLRKIQGSTLVYCRNRGTCVHVAQFLSQNNFNAGYYHAGMEPQQRAAMQDSWLSDEVPIICCTNAFGMGIDKSDVRLVVHFDAPESLEAYYQEVGRAGRDGAPSFAALMYHATEFGDIEGQVARRYPSNVFLRTLYQSIADYLRIPYDTSDDLSYNFDIVHCAQSLNIDIALLSNALMLLEQQGLMQLSESIMVPSKVQCIASRAQLDHAEQFLPNYDGVLKAILRLYAGIFYAPVSISETKIGAHCSLDVNQVRSCLQALHTQEYILYHAAKDRPQLVLLQERLHDYDVRLDEQLLDFLRNTYEQRLRKAVNYFVAEKTCRSQMIANYFGEEQTNKCGTCNNCTRHKKQSVSREILDTLQQRIKDLLQAQQHSLRDLENQLTNYDQMQVQQAVHELLELDAVCFKANGNLKLNND
jgi:ATP-dependent DNA helicase RecQ